MKVSRPRGRPQKTVSKPKTEKSKRNVKKEMDQNKDDETKKLIRVVVVAPK